MKRFQYEAPESLNEAVGLMSQPGAVAMGGGTDLLGVLKDGLLDSYPETVVSLKRIPGFDRIESREDGLHIGAGATLRAVADSETVKNGWAAVADAARSVATPNLRNTATVAGNICQDVRCWYYRYPDILGGKINCARKDGNLCSAMMGENRYHSIFGAAKVTETACTGKCPAHTDIPAYMQKMREGKMDEAAAIILEVNPMPAITSRVCAHFCMEGCNRQKYDESLNVGAVERSVGDYILANAEKFMKAPAAENGKSASIIGSGPSGLAAAYYLREAGWKVTLYERLPEPGGCLRYAIPAYRLPKDVLGRFIDALRAMGVEFRCNCEVGRDVTLGELRKASDCVLLDSGTWKRPLIGMKGEEHSVFGLEFLIDVNAGTAVKPGSDVVVVGGGNVAMDVAIAAKRLGAERVTMVVRKPREGMAANEEEIERALADGVEILNNYAPDEVLTDENGKVRALRMAACRSFPVEGGRMKTVTIEGEFREIAADCVMMAVGQASDLGYLEGAVASERGRIVAAADGSTALAGVYAAGDAVTGPATVIKAIAGGKAAAIAMNAGCGLPELPVETKVKARPRGALLSFAEGCSCTSCAQKQPQLGDDERALDKEDVGALDESAVKCEVNRCFNCGCLAVNPSDMANMLYACDAKIVTDRRTLTAREFFAGDTKVSRVLEPGELVVEIVVPKLPEGAVAAYSKYRVRKSIDFAVLAVAGWYKLDAEGRVEDLSLVMGAVAPIPMKLDEVEAYLKGRVLNAETAAEAAELSMKHALPLKMNEYKIDMAKVLLRRFLGF